MAAQQPAQSALTETEAQDLETPLQEVEEDPVDAESAEEPETPAPAPKRGRPKGSKDAQPRTRTRPEPHTPSKQYLEIDSAGAMRHLEEVMQSAQRQEVLRKHEMYKSWLPY